MNARAPMYVEPSSDLIDVCLLAHSPAGTILMLACHMLGYNAMLVYIPFLFFSASRDASFTGLDQ